MRRLIIFLVSAGIVFLEGIIFNSGLLVISESVQFMPILVIGSVLCGLFNMTIPNDGRNIVMKLIEAIVIELIITPILILILCGIVGWVLRFGLVGSIQMAIGIVALIFIGIPFLIFFVI